MKKILFKILLAFLCVASSPIYAEDSKLEIRNSSRRIDFRLFYPIPQLKSSAQGISIERRQMGTAGVGLKYHFYYTDYFGVAISPSAWFLPVRVGPGGNKKMLYALSMELGAILRPLPNSFMDPGLSFMSGISGMSVGGGISRSFTPPLVSGLDLNLYRDVNRFRDTELAFNLSGRATYYPQPIKAIEPWFFDVGIAFRGSF